MYICAQNMLAYCPRQTKNSVNIHKDTTKKNLQAHVPRVSKQFFPSTSTKNWRVQNVTDVDCTVYS